MTKNRNRVTRHTLRRKARKKHKYAKRDKVYRKYMDSQEWCERKGRYFQAHAKKCIACKSNKRLTVHHKTYDRFGDEEDDDLCVLCRDCHTEYHDSITRRTTKSATERFIKRKRKTL